MPSPDEVVTLLSVPHSDSRLFLKIGNEPSTLSLLSSSGTSSGSHLFKECLMGLLNSKTVIYVTHQVEFLPAADIILVMKDGRITQSGKALLLAMAGYKTATILFNKMHLCIFRAPMSFFDATPSGRILNRASTDQNTVDIKIPNQVGAFAFSMIQLLGIVAVMSQVAWQVFIVFIPVITACVWYQQYYIPSARELARLVGVCKAPVIQHFAETISGSTTIRSFNQESRFRDTNMKLMDGYGRPKFYTAGAMEWLCFRMDMLSSITFAFSLVFLISVPEGVINPGIAGLTVTYGLNLNILQAWVIWNLCNMENK
ncbi:hypothetical protein M0R45_019592 [Rubus argutus]|uniref:ABC-type xenobiotic transporter n=1 Tax=Rubus argutus TaxID=59490 RepID=A0AAW1X6Q5_RUBAR